MKRTPLRRKTAMGNPMPLPDQRVRTRAPLPSPIPVDQRRGTMASAAGMTAAVPKSPTPVRSVAYRMAVGQLPCYHCRVEGCSQAAHPNTGKARGKKLDDTLCFPMCHVGAKDCHGRFDQYKLVPKAEMPAFEVKAQQWTVRELLRRGLWPDGLPVPDVRELQ